MTTARDRTRAGSRAGFAGRRIGLLESRLVSETAALVRRMGGVPICAPALREEPLPAGGAVAAFLDDLDQGRFSLVVFQTGAGVAALFDEARRLGRERELTRGLAGTALLSRGPKPAAALAVHRLRPAVSVASPYTTVELLASLHALPVHGAAVGLVHYGERNDVVAAALHARAARVVELLLYEWRLPDDTTPLDLLIGEILAGGLAAVAFTSQAQVRHLFQVARGRRGALARALEREVVTGAVGPTCAAALRAHGVHRLVVPEQPKLGPLLSALALRLRRPQASEALP